MFPVKQFAYFCHKIYCILEKKMTKFSERLKELRQEKNISTRTLASAIGVSNSIISKWEKGQRTPSIDNLYSLAVYFGVSADFLIGLSDY